MNLLKVSLFIVSSLFFSQISLAAVDVTCRGGDCLANGWSIFDTRSGERASVDCVGGDCTQDGWVERSHFKRSRFRTECTRGDCWNNGWITYDDFSGRFVSQVRCLEPIDEDYVGRPPYSEDRNADPDPAPVKPQNCLTEGWETHFANGSWTQTICTDGDCKKIGWDVEFPGRGYQTARCKAGGCFRSGWTVYP